MICCSYVKRVIASRAVRLASMPIGQRVAAYDIRVTLVGFFVAGLRPIRLQPLQVERLRLLVRSEEGRGDIGVRGQHFVPDHHHVVDRKHARLAEPVGLRLASVRNQRLHVRENRRP